MKAFFCLLTLLFARVESFAQSDSLPVSITVKVEKEYVRTYSKNADIFKTAIRQKNYVVKTDSIKQNFFDISLEIKNISNKTIKVWLMTCSWENNFIVNNNYIFIEGHECDSNFPTLVQFKPGESKVYTNTLYKSIKFDYPCENCIYGPQVETTKLGLIIIDDIFKSTRSILNYNMAMEDKSKWKILWSNPIFLLTKDQSSPNPVEVPVHKK